MTYTIKACSICRPTVRDALDRANIAYTEGKNKTMNTSAFTINMVLPTSFKLDSLAAMCWNALKFPFHHAVKNGNTISCSLAA